MFAGIVGTMSPVLLFPHASSSIDQITAMASGTANVDQVLSPALTNPAQAKQLQHFVRMETVFDSSFLRGTPPTLLAKKTRMVQKSTFVARAFSDHHWIEEWMKVL